MENFVINHSKTALSKQTSFSWAINCHRRARLCKSQSSFTTVRCTCSQNSRRARDRPGVPRGGRGRGARGRGAMRGGYDDRRGRDWEDEYYSRDHRRASPPRSYEERWRGMLCHRCSECFAHFFQNGLHHHGVEWAANRMYVIHQVDATVVLIKA
jgi:hypothetical protein